MIRQSSHVYLMLRRHFLMSSVAARIINLWKLFLTVEPDVDYKTVTLVFLHEVTRLIAPTINAPVTDFTAIDDISLISSLTQKVRGLRDNRCLESITIEQYLHFKRSSDISSGQNFRRGS